LQSVPRIKVKGELFLLFCRLATYSWLGEAWIAPKELRRGITPKRAGANDPGKYMFSSRCRIFPYSKMRNHAETGYDKDSRVRA
jgi:hypothetical protein